MDINSVSSTLFNKTCYDFISLKALLDSEDFKNIKLYGRRDTEHVDFDDHLQAYFPNMDKI